MKRSIIVETRNICRGEHDALFALAENGKRIEKIRIEIALAQYKKYLNMLNEYANERRQELRKKRKELEK